jgi:hypothetical protein
MMCMVLQLLIKISLQFGETFGLVLLVLQVSFVWERSCTVVRTPDVFNSKEQRSTKLISLCCPSQDAQYTYSYQHDSIESVINYPTYFPLM